MRARISEPACILATATKPCLVESHRSQWETEKQRLYLHQSEEGSRSESEGEVDCRYREREREAESGFGSRTSLWVACARGRHWKGVGESSSYDYGHLVPVPWFEKTL